jgi:hypothetical protein
LARQKPWPRNRAISPQHGCRDWWIRAAVLWKFPIALSETAVLAPSRCYRCILAAKYQPAFRPFPLGPNKTAERCGAGGNC